MNKPTINPMTVLRQAVSQIDAMRRRAENFPVFPDRARLYWSDKSQEELDFCGRLLCFDLNISRVEYFKIDSFEEWANDAPMFLSAQTRMSMGYKGAFFRRIALPAYAAMDYLEAKQYTAAAKTASVITPSFWREAFVAWVAASTPKLSETTEQPSEETYYPSATAIDSIGGFGGNITIVNPKEIL
jgi:hypothetical protein